MKMMVPKCPVTVGSAGGSVELSVSPCIIVNYCRQMFGIDLPISCWPVAQENLGYV